MHRAATIFVLACLSGCDRGSRTTELIVETQIRPEPTESARRPEPVRLPDGSARVPEKNITYEAQELTWSYTKTDIGPMEVVVSVPAREEGDRFPLLIVLHGWGEAVKRPADGARGWIDDYGLPRAMGRLGEPPLTEEDFLGFVEAERLRTINESLTKRPFRGLIVLSPYTPRTISDDRSGRSLRQFGDFVVDELLPRAYRETPAMGAPESTGIDGVSFGGRTALVTGLRRAEAFGAVGTLQAACMPGEAPGLAATARKALEANPSLRIRLLSSHRDGFLRANQEISKAFRALGVTHELLVVPGPHNYEFNRGPGSIEMLLFHDRALRGDETI